MTPDTAAIRARAEKATPGPWLPESWLLIFKALLKQDVQDDARAPALLVDFPTDQFRADAKFIASARTDVPALCDEIDRLRTELTCARASALNPIVAKLEREAAAYQKIANGETGFNPASFTAQASHLIAQELRGQVEFASALRAAAQKEKAG